MTGRVRGAISNRRRRFLRNTVANYNNLLNNRPQTSSGITRRTFRRNFTITKTRLVRKGARRINQPFGARPARVRFNSKVKIRRRSNRVKLYTSARLVGRPGARIKRRLKVSSPLNFVDSVGTRQLSHFSS